MKRKPVNLIVTAALALSFSCTTVFANDALKEAEAYLAKNDLKAAVIEFKNAIQEEPKNATARLKLGQTYVRMNQWQAAEKELLKAARLGAAKTEWMQPLSQALSAQGKVNEIKEHIAIDESDSNDVKAEIKAILGLVAFANGDTTEAKSLLNQSIQLKPKNASAYIGLANIGLSTQQFEDGRQAINKALEIEPDNLEAQLINAQFLMIANDADASLKQLQSVIDGNPRYIQARMLRTNILLSQQKYDDAKVDIDYLDQLIPNHFLNDLLRGKFHLMQQQWEKAEELLRSAQSKIQAPHPELEKLLSLVDVQNKNWRQAELHLISALELNNHDPAIGVLLGNLYVNQLKQPEKAVPIYQKMLESNPGSPEIIARLADAYNRSGEVNKATELLEESLADSPDTASLQTMLAQTKLTSGEVAQAIEMLESNNQSSDASLQNAWLVMSYIRAGEHTKAEQKVAEVLKDAPEDPLFNNMMGVTKLTQQRLDDALAFFEKAASIQPQYLAAQFNVARTLRALGQNDKVIAKLNELETTFPDNAKVAFALYQGYLANGDMDKAKKWLKTSVKRDGGFDPAVSTLINAELGQNNRIEAIALANQWIAVDERNPEAHFQLGRIHLMDPENSQLSQAIEAFQRSVNLGENFNKYVLALVTAYLRENNVNAAKIAMDRFMEKNPADSVVLSQKVRLLINQKEYRSADNAIRKFSRVSSEKHIVDELTADVLAAKGESNEALASYKSSYATSPSSRVAQKLHQVYVEKGNDSEAVSILSDWLNAEPSDQRARFLLATYFQGKNKKQDAIKQYRTLLEHHENDIFALNNLAWLLMELNDKSALDYAAKIEQLKPNRPDVLDTLGWVYVQFDQPKKGLVHLEKALQLNSDFREAKYHSAVAHYKAGDPAKAKQMIQDLVNSGKPFTGFDEAKALLKQL